MDFWILLKKSEGVEPLETGGRAPRIAAHIPRGAFPIATIPGHIYASRLTSLSWPHPRGRPPGGERIFDLCFIDKFE